MLNAHFLNLAVHVTAGIAGILLGFIILARRKGTASHRRLGTLFINATLLVVASAFAGILFFRFLPLFAVLAVLVLYQLVGGFRAARRRELGPGAFDAVWTALALVALCWLAPNVVRAFDGPPVVMYSSLGAAALVAGYDSVRWLFPRRWFARLWRYEHAYKMTSSVFAMLSAFVGNVVRWGQPWSQLLPSAVGTLIIVYFFWRLAREDSRPA